MTVYKHARLPTMSIHYCICRLADAQHSYMHRIVVLTYSKPQQQTGFPNARVTNQQQFKEVVTAMRSKAIRTHHVSYVNCTEHTTKEEHDLQLEVKPLQTWHLHNHNQRLLHVHIVWTKRLLSKGFYLAHSRSYSENLLFWIHSEVRGKVILTTPNLVANVMRVKEVL